MAERRNRANGVERWKRSCREGVDASCVKTEKEVQVASEEHKKRKGRIVRSGQREEGLAKRGSTSAQSGRKG